MTAEDIQDNIARWHLDPEGFEQGECTLRPDEEERFYWELRARGGFVLIHSWTTNVCEWIAPVGVMDDVLMEVLL